MYTGSIKDDPYATPTENGLELIELSPQRGSTLFLTLHEVLDRLHSPESLARLIPLRISILVIWCGSCFSGERPLAKLGRYFPFIPCAPNVYYLW